MPKLTLWMRGEPKTYDDHWLTDYGNHAVIADTSCDLIMYVLSTTVDRETCTVVAKQDIKPNILCRKESTPEIHSRIIYINGRDNAWDTPIEKHHTFRSETIKPSDIHSEYINRLVHDNNCGNIQLIYPRARQYLIIKKFDGVRCAKIVDY